MVHLFQLLNDTIENETALTIYIEKSDYINGSMLHLTLKYENNDATQQKIQKLKLLEPHQEEYLYPVLYSEKMYSV